MSPMNSRRNRSKNSSSKKFQGRPRSQVPSRHPGQAPPSRPPTGPQKTSAFVEGFLQLKGKFGFVLSEDPKVGDVMVQGPTLRLAMNGDRVRARVVSGPDALRRSGDIVEV